MSAGEIQIRRGWQPGALGWIIAEHGRDYAKDWGLGAAFEAKVAAALGEWMGRYNPARDLILLAQDDAGPLGSISVDGSQRGEAQKGNAAARIRFFILAPRARGLGIGRRLLGEAMAFISGHGFEHAYLTTFRGLDPARKLYEDFGFTLTHEALDTSWGQPLHEQRFDWHKPIAA